MRTIASVYQLTPLGQRCAAGLGASVRPDLQHILLAVDGKRGSRTLVQHFAFLGDVSAMLVELENMQLIAAAMQDTPPDASYEATRPASLDVLEFEETMAYNTGPASLAFPAYAPKLAGVKSSNPAQILHSVRTREVCEMMTQFILLYLPENAFDALADLERIETSSHLLAYLSHYQELVQAAGAAGSKHLAELDERIQELLSALHR